MSVSVSDLTAFNLDPLAQIDQSWLAGSPHATIFEDLSREPTPRPWLNRYLLRDAEIADDFWTDFSAPRARLALLDRSTLQRLLVRVGLVLNGDAIRKEFDGGKRRKFREQLGEDDFNFVMREATLLGRHAPLEANAGFGDQRLGFMAVGAAHALPHDLLASKAYRNRLAFRLPKDLVSTLEEFATSARGGDSAPLTALSKKILQGVAPKWLPIFA